MNNSKLRLLQIFLIFSAQIYAQKLDSSSLYITILGIAQDAGYPHPHCDKICCRAIRNGQEPKQFITSLGIVDRGEDKAFMVEATPDFTTQETMLRKHLRDSSKNINGILLTHAHIGHYTGLMYLGREAMGAKSMPVYTMPIMKKFLETNGPWSQLVSLKNIELHQLTKDSSIALTAAIKITPIQVPHRDEFSETVGYIIEGPKKKILFIPDIDKWIKWEIDIQAMVAQVDIALIDGTFFKNGEIPNRDMSEIPHPFMEETMKLFENSKDKSKIYFIHLNHTNPILRNTQERKELILKGFHVCKIEDRFEL